MEIIFIINPIHPVELKKRHLIKETTNKIINPEEGPKRNVDKKIGKSDKSILSTGKNGIGK